MDKKLYMYLPLLGEKSVQAMVRMSDYVFHSTWHQGNIYIYSPEDGQTHFFCPAPRLYPSKDEIGCSGTEQLPLWRVYVGGGEGCVGSICTTCGAVILTPGAKKAKVYVPKEKKMFRLPDLRD